MRKRRGQRLPTGPGFPGWYTDLGPAGPLGGPFWERHYGKVRAVTEEVTFRQVFRWRLVPGNEKRYPFDIKDEPLASGEALALQVALADADAAATRRLQAETIVFKPGMTVSRDEARRALLQLPDGELVDLVSNNWCPLCDVPLLNGRAITLTTGADNRERPTHERCAVIEDGRS